MEGVFYSRHSLPPFTKPTPELLSFVASALLFDSVAVVRLWAPLDPLPVSSNDVYDTVVKLADRVGAVVAFATADRMHVAQFTAEERLILWYGYFLQRERAFAEEYLPLMKAGLFNIGTRPNYKKSLFERRRLDPLIPLADEVVRRTHVGELIKRLDARLFDGAVVMAIALLDGFREHRPDLLCSTDESALNSILWMAAVVDILAKQFLLEGRVEAIPVGFDELDQGLIEEVQRIREVSDSSGRHATNRDADRVAVNILRHTLGELPTVVPRSPEALIEMRSSLQDELMEMRDSLKLAALEELRVNKNPTADDMKRVAEAKLLIPLRQLKRRLEQPNRQLRKHLLTDQSIIPGTVSLGMSLAIFAAQPGVFTAAEGLSAAMLGVLSTVLVAAMKTRSEGREMVDNSGVAFLIRAERAKPVRM